MADFFESFRIDRNAISFGHLSDSANDREYWRSKTPQERLAAMELMRQVHYGYDPETARLERVLTFLELRDLK